MKVANAAEKSNIGIIEATKKFLSQFLPVIFVSNITINAPSIMKVREVIFFYAGKTLNQPFQGVFHGDRDRFSNLTAVVNRCVVISSMNL